MSYGYLIGPMGNSDLKVDFEHIIRSLQQTWRGISVWEVSVGSYLLRWKAEVRGFRVLGGLQSNAQTISIDHTDTTVDAEFALWYRRFVPPEHKLFLYSGPRWETPIELFPDTSVEEVLAWIDQG